MVNIAGFNLNLGNANQWLQTFQNFIIWFIISIIVIGIIAWFIFGMNKKKTYVYPVTLFRVSEKGDILKEVTNLKGGLGKNSLGMRDFKVIIPKQFKKFSLGYIPDFGLAENDGRLLFVTQGDSTLWQQCTRKVITEIVEENEITEEEINDYKTNLWKSINVELKDSPKEEKERVYFQYLDDFIKNNKKEKQVNRLLIMPVPAEIKTKVVNDLTKTRLLLDKTKMTAIGIAIGAFLIMVIAHLISLYIQTKIRCPTPTG